MSTGQSVEYRVAHLRERLACGEAAELGVRVEVEGGQVRLRGTVPTAGCREEVVRLAHEELAGMPVVSELAVAGAGAPDHAEDLA